MSTKYRVSPRARWQLETGVSLTMHALQRWDERAPADSVSPERAFELSNRADWVREYFRQVSGDPCDSVRCHKIGDTVLIFLVRERAVVTVLTIEMVRDRAVAAYLNKRAEGVGSE